MVVAVGKGLRSPGHLPRRSSFGFHGDLTHGGISGDACFCCFCVCSVCVACRIKIFSGGMKNTDRVRHTMTMTTDFPFRANHLNDSSMLPCRLRFSLASTMLSPPRTIGVEDEDGSNDFLDEGSDRLIIFNEVGRLKPALSSRAPLVSAA